MANEVEPVRRASRGMTPCLIAGFAIGAIFLGIVLSQVPDLIRYTRISNM
ncbi:MAG TPA: hypothetical protein VFA12_07360 [Stellaceae bacterium]|nr:hypothetical protein [Stellaceae bacterium]